MSIDRSETKEREEQERLHTKIKSKYTEGQCHDCGRWMRVKSIETLEGSFKQVWLCKDCIKRRLETTGR
jgi:hypothetical protein